MSSSSAASDELIEQLARAVAEDRIVRWRYNLSGVDRERFVEQIMKTVIDDLHAALPVLAAAGWGDVSAAERRGREAAIADLRDSERYYDWLAAHKSAGEGWHFTMAARYLEAQTKPVEGE